MAIDAGAPLTLTFDGARPVRATPGPELPGKVNYFLGNDPKQWRVGLPTYCSLSYRNIYSGIDVVYRGTRQQMEFDLVLRPGAHPERVRMKFAGANGVILDADGALVVHGRPGDWRIPLPVVYQDTAGGRRKVAAHYQILPNGEVGFRLSGFDRSKTLTIDPSIVYSEFIGGSQYTETAGIAVDASGDAYIAGRTGAPDYPTANAAYSQIPAVQAGFVTKIDPTGTALLYSTYIGGMGLWGIAVDSTGAALVTGDGGTNFPLLNAYQSTASGAVVAKLNSSGALQYSTYLGTSAVPIGIAVDSNGNAYAVATGTVSTTPGAFLANTPGGGAFVAEFDSAGGLVYATYLGISSQTFAIAADANGGAYVIGYTGVSSYPSAPAGGAQPVNAGDGDAYIIKLEPGGATVDYFTFLGGTGIDSGRAIAVDANGNAYVGGSTTSTDFPVTQGALQTVPNHGEEGFVAKLNSSGSAFEYVSYMPAPVYRLAIDGNGDVYVTGGAGAGLPTVLPIEPILSANADSLYRSIDGGRSWQPFDANLTGTVTSIAPDSGSGAIVVVTNAGIYRSTDQGQSWTQTLAAGSTVSTSVARSPVNGSILIACCEYSYLSMDGGITWAQEGYVSNESTVTADSTSEYTAYAYPYPALVTTNGGGEWTQFVGLPEYSGVATMVSAGGAVYADTGGGGVYKSTNHASSWINVSAGLPSLPGQANGLAISLSNPSVLYKSMQRPFIYATDNGGASWNVTPGTAPVNLGALAASPTDPSTVYAAAMSGYPALYKSSDGGATWVPSGNGLGIATVTQIVPDAADSSLLYAIATVPAAAYVAEINPSGSAFVYSTYLGSSASITATGIAVLSTGDAFVTGYGLGTFPSTNSAFAGVQIPINGNYQAFAVRISNAPANCSYIVSPAAQTVAGSNTSAIYTVLAPGGCAWNAGSDQGWATVAQGVSGSGTGVIYVALSANTTSAARQATLTIGDQTVTLTQSINACDPNLDGVVNVLDVQAEINQALGTGFPVNDPNGDGAVNVIDVQTVIQAALGQGCN